jgi:hypothetical protein
VPEKLSGEEKEISERLRSLAAKPAKAAANSQKEAIGHR